MEKFSQTLAAITKDARLSSSSPANRLKNFAIDYIKDACIARAQLGFTSCNINVQQLATYLDTKYINVYKRRDLNLENIHELLTEYLFSEIASVLNIDMSWLDDNILSETHDSVTFSW